MGACLPLYDISCMIIAAMQPSMRIVLLLLHKSDGTVGLKAALICDWEVHYGIRPHTIFRQPHVRANARALTPCMQGLELGSNIILQRYIPDLLTCAMVAATSKQKMPQL
jgi:hypothetical protein